jgi:hypothetical protein
LTSGLTRDIIELGRGGAPYPGGYEPTLSMEEIGMDMNMVREYFYQEVREAGNGEWYPRWWGVVTWDTYVAAVQSRYNFTPEYDDDDMYEDDIPLPTHMIICADIPVDEEDGSLVTHYDNVHGQIYPIVVSDGVVRAWAGHTIDECQGGGPDLQDEEYAKARQWVLNYGVSDIHEEPVPGLE